jgi:RHS repeat-associated protein
VTALVNTSGQVVERYVYDPYGQVTILDASWNTRSSSSYAWRYLFQGKRYDSATGLYDSRNRAYSPTLGRWLQNDPLGFGGGDSNLYRGDSNNPAGYADPLGLTSFMFGAPEPSSSTLGYQVAADGSIRVSLGHISLGVLSIRFGDVVEAMALYPDEIDVIMGGFRVPLIAIQDRVARGFPWGYRLWSWLIANGTATDPTLRTELARQLALPPSERSGLGWWYANVIAYAQNMEAEETIPERYRFARCAISPRGAGAAGAAAAARARSAPIQPGTRGGWTFQGTEYPTMEGALGAARRALGVLCGPGALREQITREANAAREAAAQLPLGERVQFLEREYARLEQAYPGAFQSQRFPTTDGGRPLLWQGRLCNHC